MSLTSFAKVSGQQTLNPARWTCSYGFPRHFMPSFIQIDWELPKLWVHQVRLPQTSHWFNKFCHLVNVNPAWWTCSYELPQHFMPNPLRIDQVTSPSSQTTTEVIPRIDSISSLKLVSGSKDNPTAAMESSEEAVLHISRLQFCNSLQYMHIFGISLQKTYHFFSKKNMERWYSHSPQV